MSEPRNLEEQTQRAIQGLATSTDHLERLTHFLSRLLHDSNRTETAGRGEVLSTSLGKIERVSTALRACLREEEVSTRCAQTMLEQIDSGTETPEPERECVLSGKSPGIDIAELLELLSSHRKTGTLRIQAGDEMFTLEILEGDIVHAVSDSPPLEARLGNILVARGAVDAQTLEQFFVDYGDSSGRMGEALQTGEFVTVDDLRAALEHQVQELFHRLFSAPEFAFSFYSGAAAAPELHVRMNVVHLLLESARSFDEGTSASAEAALPGT